MALSTERTGTEHLLVDDLDQHTRWRAALAVAAHATDPDDAREMLQALGLDDARRPDRA